MRERGTTVGSTTTEGGGPTVVEGGSTAGDVVEVGAVVDVVVEVVVLDATGTDGSADGRGLRCAGPD
ncbi:MAG: hypothetical protein F2692_03260 [Actinobacteria bacterium]|nr:hypothetical protein [Actinomycetota bacterium]MSY70998.1 hypothetical protein [Actinomycetota bacterium]